MSRWITKDVAIFRHNPNPNTTIIGEVRCLFCEWQKEPTSQLIFPTIDDLVEEHVRAAHPDSLNAAGVQRAPQDDDLVYYVILNP
jgi:hypothetical protein